MKKFISILFSVVMLISTVGCSKEEKIKPADLKMAFTAEIVLNCESEGELKGIMTRSGKGNWSFVYDMPQALGGLSITAKGGKYETEFCGLSRAHKDIPFSKTSSVYKLINLLDNIETLSEFETSQTDNGTVFTVHIDDNEYKITADSQSGQISSIKCSDFTAEFKY